MDGKEFPAKVFHLRNFLNLFKAKASEARFRHTTLRGFIDFSFNVPLSDSIQARHACKRVDDAFKMTQTLRVKCGTDKFCMLNIHNVVSLRRPACRHLRWNPFAY